MNTQAREAMGTCIRMARMTQALTQTDLARKVGVSVSHIQEIEEGLIVSELETLAEICNALALSPDYVLGRSKVNAYNGLRLLN